MHTDQESGQTKGAGNRIGAMKHEGITEKIIGVFYDVYNELGHGFLESVYEESMAIALREAGHHVIQQAPVSVHFRGQVVGDFRADLLANDEVIVELKAARAIESAHEAQLMNYLRATRMEVGLLMNFGSKAEFKRFIFDNDRKDHR
jgi:GxxExxY protein